MAMRLVGDRSFGLLEFIAFHQGTMGQGLQSGALIEPPATIESLDTFKSFSQNFGHAVRTFLGSFSYFYFSYQNREAINH